MKKKLYQVLSVLILVACLERVTLAATLQESLTQLQKKLTDLEQLLKPSAPPGSIAKLYEDQPDKFRLRKVEEDKTEYTLLDLSDSGITSLEGLDQLPSDIKAVQILVLEDNQIASIPTDAFQGLSNLIGLYLSKNKIKNIPTNELKGLTQLKYLDLENNQIAKIEPDAFQGLSTLEGLFLMNNQIASIEPKAFQGLSKLQTLDLENNQIAQIEPKAFQGLSKLETLDLSENNLDDENQKAIKKFLKFPKVRIWL